MAIAVPFTHNSQFGASGGTTASLDTTGVTLLIVALDYQKVAGRNLTDSKGNTWTQLTAYEDTVTNCAAVIYYCENPTVGTGHTFSTTSHFCGLTVLGVTGEDTTSYDVSNGAFGFQGGGSTFQPGSVTPSQNGSLIVTSVYQAAGLPAPTIPSGYTTIAVWAVGTAFPGGCGYKIQTTAAAENPSWGVNAGGNCAANIAVFKPVAAAPSGNSNFLPFFSTA